MPEILARNEQYIKNAPSRGSTQLNAFHKVGSAPDVSTGAPKAKAKPSGGRPQASPTEASGSSTVLPSTPRNTPVIAAPSVLTGTPRYAQVKTPPAVLSDTPRNTPAKSPPAPKAVVARTYTPHVEDPNDHVAEQDSKSPQAARHGETQGTPVTAVTQASIGEQVERNAAFINAAPNRTAALNEVFNADGPPEPEHESAPTAATQGVTQAKAAPPTPQPEPEPIEPT